MKIDEEYLQKLMRTVSHDMGGTLRVSVGFSKLLLENYADQLDEKALNWLALIKSDSEKTQECLVALSRYARLYGISDNPGPSDLNALCQKAIKISNFAEFYPDLHVDVEELPIVEGYERLWVDFFAEILLNSAKHSGGAASIRCRVRSMQDDRGVHIIVEDTGVGMTLKEIEMALQPFRTVESVNGAGVGMGLAIAKRIVELQGGELIVRSGVDGSMGLQVTALLPPERLIS